MLLIEDNTDWWVTATFIVRDGSQGGQVHENLNDKVSVGGQLKDTTRESKGKVSVLMTLSDTVQVEETVVLSPRLR